ncbi:MAG: hypothetical protein ABJA98_12425 [Acidobacteriota bacterium]
MSAKFFMNGGVDSNWSSDTNWSTTAATGPNNTTHAVNGDTVTINASSPSCVVDTASACTSVNFTGYTNTFTFTANLTVAGAVTLAAGMTIAGTADLLVTATATLTSGGQTLTGGLQFTGSVQTYTLSGTWTVNGVTRSNGANLNAINSGAITCAGGLQVDSALQGTTVFTLTGGTWAGAATITNSITFAGNPTISGTVTFNTGTMTWASGTPVVTGSTINVTGNATWNLAGMSLNNMSVSALTVQTLTSDLTLLGALVMPAGAASSMSWSGAHAITCASCTITGGTVTLSGTLTISGDLTLPHTVGTTFVGAFQITAGTATVSGTQTITLAHDVTITGVTTINDANVLNGSGLTWTTGSLAGAGSPFTGTATVIIAGNRILTIPVGALALSGLVLTLGGDHVFSVPVGTLTLSGTLVGVRAFLPVGAGAVSSRLFAAPQSSEGISITPNATPGAWSDWCELDASTAVAWLLDRLLVHPGHHGFFDGATVDIEVGVGAAGAEVTVDRFRCLYLLTHFVSPGTLPRWPLLDAIPAGSRVSLRLRKNNAFTEVWKVKAYYYKKPGVSTLQSSAKPQKTAPDGASLTTLTVGATAWANSTWTTLIASTATDIAIVAVVGYGDSGYTEWEFDIGVGEPPVAVSTPCRFRNTQTQLADGPWLFPVYPPLAVFPMGSQVSVRTRASIVAFRDAACALVYLELPL